MAAMATSAFSQGSTVSPYSQYGFGELAPQGVGVNRAMNGLGIALQRGNQVNPINPASYASVDSLTMLFDMGVSGQITSFNENGVKLNARTANVDYVVGAFRAWRNVGITFGLLPYSNIGYDYHSTQTLSAMQTTVTTNNFGDGGLHQLFIGAGFRPVKPVAIGFNFSYLWGGFDKFVDTSSSSTINSLMKNYTADVDNFSLDLGLQVYIPLGKEDQLTLGATYGLGHKLKADAACLLISTNSSIAKADTTKTIVKNALELPHTFGAGVSFSHGQQLVIGADAQMQRWGKTQFPTYADGEYTLRSGLLKNSYRLTVGGEYCPLWNGRRFFQRVRYRFGAGYTTPYYKINGQDGPRQYSASIGFGICGMYRTGGAYGACHLRA